jgi:hypothetical protein
MFFKRSRPVALALVASLFIAATGLPGADSPAKKPKGQRVFGSTGLVR